MNYSEVKKEQVMKAMCELCDMCSNYGENFECCQYIFPCSLVTEAFDKVIEILEDKE